MLVSLTIVRYPKYFIPIAFISMAVLRLPLALSKSNFWKLMGCGRNGTFDINPDWQQWACMTVWNSRTDFEQFREHSAVWKKVSKTKITKHIR